MGMSENRSPALQTGEKKGSQVSRFTLLKKGRNWTEVLKQCVDKNNKILSR